MKWKELAVNRMLLVVITRRANTFFMIVQRKLLKGAEILVMTVKGRGKEKQGLRPGGNVIDMAAAMGIEPLTEEQYRELQKLGYFDNKTQSWLKTPPDIRDLGGALFADYRFGHVFVYHNTAPCFYSGRAFRGSLRV